MKTLRIITPGSLSLIQDRGRPGYAHLGVSRSGACDLASHDLANRLVGNDFDAATIEVLFGGLAFTIDADTLVAVTGTMSVTTSGGRPMGCNCSFIAHAGDTVRVGFAKTGLRTYVAIRGGIDAPSVLGSRSTDTLGGIGPEPLSAGAILPIGSKMRTWPATDFAPVAVPDARPHALTALRGPREDLLSDPDQLYTGTWIVATDSDRVGLRCNRPSGGIGDALLPRNAGTLPSEGIARGSIQIPPSGQPVIFLADHPVTGGYPVVAVLTAESCDRAAQLRPGDEVRFIF